MDRAIASGAIGREFESLRAHHSSDPSPEMRLRTSAAGSPFHFVQSHARKTPQVRISPGAPEFLLSEAVSNEDHDPPATPANELPDLGSDSAQSAANRRCTSRK